MEGKLILSLFFMNEIFSETKSQLNFNWRSRAAYNKAKNNFNVDFYSLVLIAGIFTSSSCLGVAGIFNEIFLIFDFIDFLNLEF
jgi:hypothetical protein